MGLNAGLEVTENCKAVRLHVDKLGPTWQLDTADWPEAAGHMSHCQDFLRPICFNMLSLFLIFFFACGIAEITQEATSKNSISNKL